MNRNPYDPPQSPVAHPAASATAKRWKWLVVPIYHAIWTFMMLLVEWWWTQPVDPAGLLFRWDAQAVASIARITLLHGTVVLLTTCLAVRLLPKIDIRDAVRVSLVSVIGIRLIPVVAYYGGLKTWTNGQQVITIAVVYLAIVLISGVVIRRRTLRIVA
jgi:hypothetical protein